MPQQPWDGARAGPRSSLCPAWEMHGPRCIPWGREQERHKGGFARTVVSHKKRGDVLSPPRGLLGKNPSKPPHRLCCSHPSQDGGSLSHTSDTPMPHILLERQPEVSSLAWIYLVGNRLFSKKKPIRDLSILKVLPLRLIALI